MKDSSSLILFASLCALILGCNSKRDESKPRSPRPVSVLALVETDPGRFDRYTGAVASWKTDQLGFEVAGRVEFVIEPETDISGSAGDDTGSDSPTGTLLARLDPTRYELNVQAAKSEIATAEKRREAAQIELDSVIPAQQEAARAMNSLAKIEVGRNEALVEKNAVSERELDISQAKLKESEAELKQLEATREAKRAEVASIDAKIGELQEALRQAERDLADCQLYWSVPGQVAQVHVIAGSYVERGERVLTVQMMHPIKVEFEVAGETARALNHRDQVKIYIPQADGTTRERVAIIYMIDPIADPQTRTFTITLMLPNKRVRSELPAGQPEQVVARTNALSMLITGFGDKPNSLFVNEEYLQQDDEGSFLWKVVNRRVGTMANASERMLKIERIRVTPGETRTSVLGIAVLREVQLADGEQFDPALDMITGKIVLPPGADQRWSGDSVFYDVERWELRPGDLVSVDLVGSRTQPGFFVPLDAISEMSGKNYVFVVESAAGGDTARRVEVALHDPVGTLRRIEAVGDQPLEADAKIVAAGAAFLVDGERVNVAEEVRVRR
jgi:multidrug efflux pump subunit AcrA (membrane-fusion protein)